MSTHTASAEVNVPVSAAYGQWTLFEEFPKFMDNVQSVTQINDSNLHWVAEIMGVTRSFDTMITAQKPDQLISWATTEGSAHSGSVEFEELTPTRCRVSVTMSFEPEGVAEKAGDKLGFVSSRVEGDLKRFCDFIESKGMEEGSWRGTIEGGQVTKGD